MKKLFILFLFLNCTAFSMYRMTRLAAVSSTLKNTRHQIRETYEARRAPAEALARPKRNEITCKALVTVKYPTITSPKANSGRACFFEEERCKRFNAHSTENHRFYWTSFASSPEIRNYVLFLFLQKYPEYLPVDPEYFPWPNRGLKLQPQIRQIVHEYFNAQDGWKLPADQATFKECAERYYADVHYRELLENCCKGDLEKLLNS